jgi:hypothetical protein
VIIKRKKLIAKEMKTLSRFKEAYRRWNFSIVNKNGPENASRLFKQKCIEAIRISDEDLAEKCTL